MASFGMLNKLCPPAFIYFVISIVFLILAIIFLTTGSIDMNTMCLDDNCTKPGVAFLFVIKFLFILFWTWVLNFICRSGYTGVSWFLLVLPYILLIISFLIVYELVKRSPNVRKTVEESILKN
jgi:hypothetical protein